MGRTPDELLDGLSSEDFAGLLVCNDLKGPEETEPEMDPAEFVKRTS